jgi:type IV pilus assembly protein PilM
MLKALTSDPPPLVVLELDETGVSGVRRHPRTLQAEARADRFFAPGVVDPAPGRPNIREAQTVEDAVRSLLEELNPVKRNEAALILPDESSRLTVLDFDALPSNRDERMKLFRFRLAKAVPFDVQEARLAAAVQRNGHGVSALVAITAAEVVRQYENILERVGLWPGHVSVSTASALNLVPSGGGMTLFAKLSSRLLTLCAVDGDTVRMVRTVERAPEAYADPERALDDMLSDLYPTLVFIADNLGAEVDRLTLCGFGELLGPALLRFPADLGCAVDAVRTAEGPAGARECGIWGYLKLQ